MPLLDTVVLFGTADFADRHHELATKHLNEITEPETFVGTFTLLEFDIVMKSLGLSFEVRMAKHAALLRDYPQLANKVTSVSPSTFYLASKLEEEAKLEYFDAGVAAEALQLDGEVVSTDKVFDTVEGLKRTW